MSNYQSNGNVNYRAYRGATCHYKKVENKEDDLKLEEAIIQIYLQLPFYGYRRVSEELRRKGLQVNRKRICRIIRDIGIKTIDG